MSKPTVVFKLTCEDWTGLGGPMGTERTRVIFTKLFHSVDDAKRFAEKDYKRQKKTPIKWRRSERKWFSGDLLYCAYYISREEVR